MNHVAEDILMHYGIERRSGRYPWGSGKEPYQHSGDFLSRIDKLKKDNFVYTDEDGKTYTGDVAIAKYFGLTTTQLRIQKSLASNERRSLEVDAIKALKEKGLSTTEIARRLGYANESSVRSKLNEKSEERMNSAMATAEILKKLVDEKGMIDVGAGAEYSLGNVSREKLNTALYILELEGYNTFGGGVPTGPNRQTNIKVLCPPGTPYKVLENGKKVSSAIYDYGNIHTIDDYISYDGGASYRKAFEYPASMDSSRVSVRYAEDGGIAKDGVVEIRRGVDDLSLGKSKYAQVRILVDGTHYIKGMAVYSDDIPDGCDLVFNTNKKKGTPLMDSDPKAKQVLKPIKDDPDNPFGALIKEHGGQSYYDDENGSFVDPLTGKKQSLSLINKNREEGDWNEWSNTLSSQFLSKQPKELAKRQLDMAITDKLAEYDEICSLTNPTVKKLLLSKFSDECDSAAVHLDAASLPRQRYQVLLPIPSMKENEVYAPNYKDGETVALIRYPHGGTFEIPILKVNNKHEEARKVLGNNPKDAIGINSKVAEILSGADFDGDTAMVIPCNSSKSKVFIKSTPRSHPDFESLRDFDPKLEYGGKPEGTFKLMRDTQKQMGVISNLITDMTLLGAPNSDIVKAVKHSMVVIDAEKHKLDYKQSEKVNDIAHLKRKWQGHVEEGKYREGAHTLISKASSEVSIPKRRGSPKTDPLTGEQIWKESTDLSYDVAKLKTKGEVNGTIIKTDKGKKYVMVDGSEKPLFISGKSKFLDGLQSGQRVSVDIQTKQRTQKSTKMAETRDAFSLVSDATNPIETLYASFANKMKSLANKSRLEILATKSVPYSASAKDAYQKEVASLTSKLNIALKNHPRERKAQMIANTEVEAKLRDNPDMTEKEKKKIRQMALTQARLTVGAKSAKIDIEDREWEAIQAGAISTNKLSQILDHADIDKVRERATPKSTKSLSQAKINKIKAMEASGYSTSQIAENLGVSSSTVLKYL